MRVLRYNIFCVGCDCTVNKLVVVFVCLYQMEVVIRRYEANEAATYYNLYDIGCNFSVCFPRNHFFILF